jgi:NitT/TauT family transport system substrate-binding protein
VPATAIASKVTYKEEEKNADLCVMPVTAASKLLGNGENYTMLGAVTHGNLYLIAKEGEEVSADCSSLMGKKVGVLQINEVPGLTFKATLNKYGIPWQELTNEGIMAVDKVNLVAISGPEAVGTIDADFYMIAEPAASAQAKKGYTIVGNLQTLYGGENGYPQAVLVAKKSLVEEKAQWVKEFVSKVEGSAEWLSAASGEDIVAAVSAHMEDKTSSTSLKAPLLSTAVLERCGIYFTYAAACSVEVEEFLEGLLSVNDKAAAIPQSAFYWSYM